MKLTEKLFGTHSQRELKRIIPLVDKIESLRDGMMALSDEELRAKTAEYKARFQAGETLDDLLPEALFYIRDVLQKCVPVKVRLWFQPYRLI